MDERLERTSRAAREAGADGGSDQPRCSGRRDRSHRPDPEAGPSPCAGGPSLALIGKDGSAGLVVANVEAAAAAKAWVDEVVVYEGFGFEGMPPTPRTT